MTGSLLLLSDLTSTSPKVFLCVSLLVCLWKILGAVLQYYLTKKFTVIRDLPNLGKCRPVSRRIRGTAVICGGSMAGLWAARICADHFEEVLIVEPESCLHIQEARFDLANEKEGASLSAHELRRTRVGHYGATHGYQALALQALNILFPGVKSKLRELGWNISPAVYNARVYGGEMMKLHADLVNPRDLDVFFVTRDSYERLLRGLVLKASARVRSVQGTVTGLNLAPDDSGRIESVNVKTANEDELIPAALVIDCTGSSQAGFKWLRRLHEAKSLDAMAYSATKVTYSMSSAGYSRFRFYVPPGLRNQLPIPRGYDNSGMIYSVFPKIGIEKSVVFVQKMQRHCIEFYIGGWGENDVPRNLLELQEFFTNFAESEKTPKWFLDLIEMLLAYEEPADRSFGSYPEPSWIKYDEAPYLPSNFVALGDAVMVVNPLFGQGCTKATIGAITLDRMLRQPSSWSSTKIPDGFSREFFRTHRDRTQGSTWDGTKCIDYQWDSTTPVKGELRESERSNALYSIAIMSLAATDKHIDTTLVKVRSFLAPPTDFMHPSIIAKVALFRLKKALGY